VSFPRPIAWSCLRITTTTTTTIIIITLVGIPLKPLDLPRILSHLQLEVPSKLDKLLVLCHGRLDLKEDSVKTSSRDAKKKKKRKRRERQKERKKGKEDKDKENSLLVYSEGRDNL